MTLPELPKPPEPEEIRAVLPAGGPLAPGSLPWSRFFHFAATRGWWHDPAPLLWVDALFTLVEASHGLREEDEPSLQHELERCVTRIGELPRLPLETKWLRQTPREDAPFVYTGSLVDVLEGEGLEEAALRLSRVLRTVGSYDYARELLRDAAAWAREDSSASLLRVAHAAGMHAAWIDEDPAERERARAILLRCLGHIFASAPSLPSRPPRGLCTPLPVLSQIRELAAADGEWAARTSSFRRSGTRAIVGFLVTVGRAQEDTRVLQASLAAALASRWARLLEGGEPDRGSEDGVEAGGDGLLFRADLAWIATRSQPEVARALRGRVEKEGSR